MNVSTVTEQTKTSPQSIDPRTSVTVLLGFLIAFAWSAFYLADIELIEHFRLKTMDAIVGADTVPETNNSVVVVVIDEQSLDNWGQ